jgi:putative membrane protein
MPTRNRVPLIFAIAMLATSGCRDDMQPDNLAAPGAKAPESTLARPGEPASAMPASDAGTPSTDASADPDRIFARSALASGIAEVKISHHVEERSPTSDVRTLAKRIADDHEALNGKLRSFAGPDADAVDTDASAKAMDALIRSSEGTDLDRAYLQHMVDGHARSIAKYEAAASTVRDDALRTLAKNALPKLREHARAVDAQLSRSK